MRRRKTYLGGLQIPATEVEEAQKKENRRSLIWPPPLSILTSAALRCANRHSHLWPPGSGACQSPIAIAKNLNWQILKPQAASNLGASSETLLHTQAATQPRQASAKVRWHASARGNGEAHRRKGEEMAQRAGNKAPAARSANFEQCGIQVAPSLN
jgi:hypothetical protein